MNKINKDNISGILLLNKSIGLSSNNILQKIKYLFNAEKAGHTGTLDPLASGLLPICLGEATKFSSYLLNGDKEYIATIKLGVETTTYDLEGQILNIKSTQHLIINDIKNTILSFIGIIEQVPPIYSALKLNGKPLYKYALNKESIEIKSRIIEIKNITIIDINQDLIKIKVTCSKGTYIRSLAHDIGHKLGVGAHLIELIRTKTNNFSLDNNITFEYLSNINKEDRLKKLLPIDEMLSSIPIIRINQIAYEKIIHGNHIKVENLNQNFYLENHEYRIYYNDQFIGLGILKPNKILQPKRLIKNIS
jgi:tRNA pseudouridine55 synthase